MSDEQHSGNINPLSDTATEIDELVRKYFASTAQPGQVVLEWLIEREMLALSSSSLLPK